MLENTLSSCFCKRRQALLSKLGNLPVILAAGWERLRNPSNTWAYRVESHVLYLAGKLPAGAFITLCTDAEGNADARIYLEPVSIDDAVWCGPGEAWSVLEQRTGATVHPLAELGDYVAAIGQDKWASIPVQDPRANKYLESLLGRSLDIKGDERDHKLALALAAVRLIHDEAAIRGLREAGKLTVAAHLAGMKAIRAGGDERDVVAAMMCYAIQHGSEVTFSPIISQQGERLHQPYSGGTLREGALLLVDFGVEGVDGWAGDVTNTLPVSGRFTDRQRELFDLVVKAYDECVALLKPGVRYRCVHMHAAKVLAEGLVKLGILKGAVEDLIDRDVHALFFPHGIGHLVGLDVHDMEDLGDIAGYQEGRERSTRFGLNCLRLDRDLQPGMAMSIEPGLYFIPELLDNSVNRDKFADYVNWDKVEEYREARGIRFERVLLITETGSECLNPGLPANAQELEELLQ